MRNRILLILVGIMLVALPLFGACAAPAPTPTTPTPAPTPTTPALEKPIELTFGHHMPPMVAYGPPHLAWVKELEEKTGGRVKVNVSWGGVLGKPTEYFDLVLGGIADAAAFCLPWTPGRFPMSEIFELPISLTLPEPDLNIAMTKAVWMYYKQGFLDDEFAEVKLLNLWNTGSYQCLCGDKPIATVADFKGKKLRSTGVYQVAGVEALGAVPVSMAAGDIYPSIDKGVIDGAFTPYSQLIDFKLIEVVSYITETNIFGFLMGSAMNKDTFEGLPKDIQAIIDEMSESEKHFVSHGRGMGEVNAEAKAMFEKGGGTVIHFSSAEMEKMNKLLAPLWSEWIADKEAKGLPGKKAVDALLSIFKELGIDKPFIGYP